MTLLFGEYALAGSMLTAMAILIAVFAFLRHGNEGLLRAARWGQALLAGLLTISAWGLVKALLDDNFKLAYVVEHSEKSLAFGYKIAAFWAGQQGSMLFWAWVLGLMGLVLAWRLRKETTTAAALTIGTMAIATGFFTCVMLFAGNPFELAKEAHTNGEGLNPQLQNLAMVIHPPLLFLGYAGYTVPFALLVGGLLSKQKDNQWLRLARPWMMFSWIVLTAGILLGAQWAYVELGWGGYWAWDPVENASLLPWLTGTALLHSAILQLRRGMFKVWTAFLTVASFFLCVLGTYLTRSGVIQSVHAFQESSIGTFFLVYLILIGLVSAGIILFNLRTLKSDHQLESIVSREGFFLLGNVLLVIMTATTVVGTIFPLLSNAFGGTTITVSGAFYNNVILPMALLLAALMSTGPVLGQGENAMEHARGKLAGMIFTGVAAAIAIWIFGYVSIWALATAATIGAVIAAVCMDVYASLKAKVHGDVNALVGLARVFTSRPRHWGAQFAHMGLAAIVMGVAGSSLYQLNQNFELHPGADAKPARIGAYTLTLGGLAETRRENHTAIVATVNVRDAAGKEFQLKPERRFYDRGTDPQQSNSEVAIGMGLFSDVYLTLAGWDDGGKTVAITAMINPLVNWIWIGGVLITLGGLICLIPAGQRSPASIEPNQAAADQEIAEAHNARERRRLRRMHPAMAARSNA